MTKKQRIIRYFVKHPSAEVKAVAAKFKASLSLTYLYRKQAMHRAQEEIAAQVLGIDIEEPYIEPKEPGVLSSRANDKQVGGDHYKNMGVQPWSVVDTWPIEQRIGYYRGSALKYLMRMGTKDQASIEVAKGQHYIQKLLEVLQEQD